MVSSLPLAGSSKVPAKTAVDANVRRAIFGALLVAGEEVADDGDVAAADEADRLAVAEAFDRAALLGHRRAEHADQERALVLREIRIGDRLGIRARRQ